MLLLISTPIGNLKDISQRAIETLKSVDLILCEDTRTTGKLMNLLGLKPYPPLLSYHDHNERKRIPEVINKLKQGQEIALVSDAGTPTLSDPGYKLVRECVREGIPVSPIPGPSAILAALVVSGFPTDKFMYLGFLPRKNLKKLKLLKNLKIKFEGMGVTIVTFESPHRLEKTLRTMREVFGDIPVAVCRELTKMHESVTVKPISKLLEGMAKGVVAKRKGEVTLVWETRGNSSE